MIIKDIKQLAQFKNYLNSIGEDSSIYVLHDTDMDGVTSAVITKKALKRLGKNNFKFEPFNHSSKREISEGFVKDLKKHKITHIIALDLALESFKNIDLLDQFKILVIDHHQIDSEKLKTKDNLLLIKHYMEDESNKKNMSEICTANLVYSFFNQVTDITDLDWLAVAGIIADATYSTEKNFVDEVLKKNNNEIKEDIFKTDFSRLVSYGTYADCIGTKEAIAQLIRALENSNNYKDAIKKLEMFKPLEDEMNKAIENYEKEKETYEDINFYEVKSKYDIKGPVSTYLSFNKPYDQTLITYQQKNGMISISARRQDKKYDMGKLMKQVCDNLENAQGGGHIPAAGAGIQAKDIQTFKEMIKKLQKTTRVE